jgi:hypothetical protein
MDPLVLSSLDISTDEVNLSSALFHAPERTGVCRMLIRFSSNASSLGQTVLHAPQYTQEDSLMCNLPSSFEK